MSKRDGIIRKKFASSMDDRVYTRMKVYAIKNKRSIIEMMESAMVEYLEKWDVSSEVLG